MILMIIENMIKVFKKSYKLIFLRSNLKEKERNKFWDDVIFIYKVLGLSF